MIKSTPLSDSPLFRCERADLLMELVNYLPAGAYVAGGAITRILSGDDTPGDFDVWTESRKAYDALKLYLQAFPPQSWNLPKMTVRAESYDTKDGEVTDFEAHDLPKVQVVGTNFLAPEDQIARFDFACCQFAIVRRAGVLTLLHGEHAIEDATNRVIRIMNNESPRRTGQRVAKYLGKGFSFLGAESKAA